MKFLAPTIIVLTLTLLAMIALKCREEKKQEQQEIQSAAARNEQSQQQDKMRNEINQAVIDTFKTIKKDIKPKKN